MLVSVVIPCYRSEKTLRFVVDEIRGEFAKRPEYDYQILLVNDGSPDAVYGVICGLCEEDPQILGIDLSRNYGQARARMAALPYIKGEYAVYMDDDGQHPAEGIFQLVEKAKEGYDVVYASFKSKKHSLFKRVTSRMFSKIVESFGIKPKGVRTSSFFCWSRFAINALQSYHSPSPSAGAYLLKVTTKFANVEMLHRERKEGKSGYTLKKLFGLALMTVTNFTTVPLRASAILGMVIAGIGFLAGLSIILRKLFNPSVAMGYTSMMAVILLLGGLILIVMGIIGEYIGRIYMILSDMPQYVIREVRLNEEVQNESPESATLTGARR